MADCKISIVIPVYNVEKYLRKCLESVVHQTFTEYEVIIVNDGSKDNSLEILKEYKANFPDLITVYHTENKGVSHARNYAVNRACGKYVLFVDSDDFIEPDMCEKLYQKAEEDKSDLVICDRYDFYENENTNRIKRTESSGFYMPFGRTIDLNKMKYELVHISPFPWDKLYRIELVKQFPFPVGSRFEDLAIMYQICILAERISVIDDYLYNYRRTTTGGFLNTFSAETKDIVKACKKIVSDFKENDWFDRFYDEIEYICARHLLLRYNVLFDQEQKGKLKLKKELIQETQNFLDSNFQNWRENRYLKYSVGKEMKRKFERYKNKNRLLRQALYHEYIPAPFLRNIIKIKQKSFHTLLQIKGFLKSKKKKEIIKKKLSFIKLFKQSASEKYTHFYETLPVNETLVFYESKHGEDIAGNIFRLILAMSEERYRRFSILLVLKKAQREYFTKLLKSYQLDYVKVIAMGSEEYLKTLATAKYLITDTSFPTYYIKRPEQIYLNTWHGTPLKAMGRIVPFREYALGNVQRNFLIADYLLYQNEFSKEVFLRDYMIDKLYQGKVMVSGYPRNCAFFDQERREKVRKLCIKNLKKEMVKGEEIQFIAYMPTWRGLLDKKESKKLIQIMIGYFEEIDLLLKEEQLFFVKLHPFVKGGIDYSIYQHIRPFPEEFETYDFLNATDVLVTDYSSIMFDYAASLRDVVLFTYDREEYLKDRGMYLDLNQIQFTKADTVKELIHAISLPSKDEHFCKEFCPYDNKNTANLVAKQLFFKEDISLENEMIRIESIPSTNKKKVLIFLGGLGKGEKTLKFIEEINALDTKKLEYYLCFNADSVKSATSMIANIKKEIGYFPIVYNINALKGEKIAMALYLRYGIKAFGVQKKIEKIAKRERIKYFGSISFDFVLNYSVKDKMLHQICKSFEKEKYINLQEIDLKRYQTDKQYHKSVRYLIKSSKGFHYGTIPKELVDAKIGIYNKAVSKNNDTHVSSLGENATEGYLVSSGKVELLQYINIMTKNFREDVI